MTENEDTTPAEKASPELDAARREFFKRYGPMAVAVPAITLLLSTTLSSPAIARSGGSSGGGPVSS